MSKIKHWAWTVAALYAALLFVLTVPGCLLAFAPNMAAREAFSAFGSLAYWIWVALMLFSQLALLSVPARVASLRPVGQGPIWRTILAGGLMAGGLVFGTVLSVYEFLTRGESGGNWIGWAAIAVGVLTWAIWSVIFFRLSRRTEPTDLVSLQCRTLLKGSILELLIAVPTHIVARYRDYCCAGTLTFVGLTMGVSVMLFAYGPAVFFLFVERWRRLHPVQAKDIP
jgi:hypothetical protein